MVTLANAFAERGYTVDLVLAVAQGPYLQEVDEAVRVVDLQAGRVVRSLFPLIRYFRQERPAALLSAMTHANVIALLARVLANISMRLVISERTTISMEANRARDFVAHVYYSLAHLLYRRADQVVAVSKAAAEDLARFTRLPASAIKVIYNPFELDRIQSRAAEELMHPWFGATQSPVVLAVGRLNQAKGHHSLIRAFSRLRAEGFHLRLMILGEGELRANLEALVSECGLTSDDVQMPGFVSNPFAYLSRCGVFVLSSRYEGLPGALIEAMACGVPVVSTDCPSGPREILESGRWGALVPVGDEIALAEAIKSVLSIPREELPDVRHRAADFDHVLAVDSYLDVLGLSPRPN